MALRRLNIDFEALARAMAKQGSDEYDYYLDTHTGRIMRISTDVWNALEEGETIAGSLNAWQQEELHEAQAVFSDIQGKADLYINGVFQDTWPYPWFLQQPTLSRLINNEAYLGHASMTNPVAALPANNYQGAIDEFRIWNGALTKLQVETSFAAGPTNATINGRGDVAFGAHVSADPFIQLGQTLPNAIFTAEAGFKEQQVQYQNQALQRQGQGNAPLLQVRFATTARQGGLERSELLGQVRLPWSRRTRCGGMYGALPGGCRWRPGRLRWRLAMV